MEKFLYLDGSYGISEDRLVGALFDLGADQSYVNRFLQKLPFGSFVFEVERVKKHGIDAKQVLLRSHTVANEEGETKATEILSMIMKSKLPERVKERTHFIFHALVSAYCTNQGIHIEDITFPNGKWKTWTAKILGICLAIESIGIHQILASPILIGKGIVQKDTGLSFFPEPAVYELLRGIPITEVNMTQPITTVVGASLLACLAKSFSGLNQMKMKRIGYGAAEDQEVTFRASIVEQFRNIESKKCNSSAREESIFILEFQVDDMTGEALGYLMQELLEIGVLDVYYTPVYMKKNRPGTLISVLTLLENVERCEEVILTETTTLGVRKSLWTRRILERKIVHVDSKFGPIRLKQAIKDGKVLRQIPEYEDVQKAAKEHHVPFYEVYMNVFSGIHKR